VNELHIWNLLPVPRGAGNLTESAGAGDRVNNWQHDQSTFFDLAGKKWCSEKCAINYFVAGTGRII
jgi:hypothetical protein